LVKSTLTRLPGSARLAHRLAAGPTILMYHRFSERPMGDGHTVDRATCEWQFRTLRKRTTVWPLGDYFEAAQAGEKIPGDLVVITVDDGYRDFYEIAFPLLRSLGLTATFFPVVEFIEGRIWLWPDALRWTLESAASGRYRLAAFGREIEIDLTSPQRRDEAWNDLCAVCVEQPTVETTRFLSALGRHLQMRIPELLPERFAPCSWSELKEMSDAGIEIGGHSMTHPILSRVDAESLVWEVAGPRAAFRERLGIEVRSFCYPNGQVPDVNASVIQAVKDAGYRGAVVTQRRVPDFRPYSTSRIGTCMEKNEFLWKSLGWEQGIASLTRRGSERVAY
jgi:Polysaccharide deacetylase